MSSYLGSLPFCVDVECGKQQHQGEREWIRHVSLQRGHLFTRSPKANCLAKAARALLLIILSPAESNSSR